MMNINISDYVRELPDDTPIYKYISKDVFFDHFFKEEGTIQFQKVSNWKDGQEGLLRDFIDKCKGEDGNINYLGCCFSLEQDMSCAFEPSLFVSANNELADFGSDAMWQIYCPNGGVRIKTTIGRVRSAIIKYCDQIEMIKHGKVLYLPNKVDPPFAKINIDKNALFIKRVSFRHEVEYRFVFCIKEKDKAFLPFNPFDMVDEFLVSPADTPDAAMLAKCIYRKIYAEVERKVGYDYSVGKIGHKPVVRISQLYGEISQEM